MARTATAQGGTSSSHTSNTAPARLAERVWYTKLQSLLLNFYFCLSGFQSSLLLIFFHNQQNTGKCSHHTIIWHKTYFEISTAQLHSVTEITPPQTFLCVNTSPIRYNFRVGAKAFCYSVNIALVFLHSH